MELHHLFKVSPSKDTGGDGVVVDFVTFVAEPICGYHSVPRNLGLEGVHRLVEGSHTIWPLECRKLCRHERRIGLQFFAKSENQFLGADEFS